MKIKEIKTKKGYRKFDLKVEVLFEHLGKEIWWIPKFEEIKNILEKTAKVEDERYSKGLGKNMFFIQYILPIYSKYLKENGFNPSENDIINTAKAIKKMEEIKDGN